MGIIMARTKRGMRKPLTVKDKGGAISVQKGSLESKVTG